MYTSDSCHVFGIGNQGCRNSVTLGNVVNFADSHGFTAIHGSNIIIDETAERDIFVKRQ
ncbi:hypothetical protein Tco_0310185, partial [Tanacetum coccineum]